MLVDQRHASFEPWREAGAVYLSTGAFDHARSVLERFVESRPYDAEVSSGKLEPHFP